MFIPGWGTNKNFIHLYLSYMFNSAIYSLILADSQQKTNLILMKQWKYNHV